jgi:hypothetical protein
LPRFLLLKNKQFTVSDDEHDYFFGVCTAANNSDQSYDGLVQINRLTKDKFIIGRLNDVDIEGGGKLTFNLLIIYKKVFQI